MSSLSAKLAAAYDRATDAIDSDGEADAEARRFADWLAGHWRRGPRPPAWPPDAVNVDSRGVLMMRWYTLGAVILGFAGGSRGCYVVPAEEVCHPGNGIHGC